METSSPGTTIQHQVENQVPGLANPTSNQSRNRRGNRPRTHVPPANTASSDVVVAPQTGGTSSRQPRRNFNQNRSQDHKQERSNPRRPPGASQTAGSSSVVDETGGGNAPPRKNRPPRYPQGATTANETNVTDSQPQSQAKRVSRRGKFNSSLSEPTPLTSDSKPEVKAHLPSQVSSLHKKVKPPRPKAPLADDLTSTLTHALSTHPYPDCPICFNPIRPEQHTWSCSSSDPSKNLQCCWTTFHLKCIRAWASKSVKDLQDAWRARGEERTGEWRCPGCQAKRESVPSSYKCFCHRITDPSPTRLVTPHSCAYPCSRVRTPACGHGCPLPCHPGPCPPCAVTVRKGCWCERQVSTVRCSSLASANSTTGVSCGVICGKPLSCGTPYHACAQVCHPGECKPCIATETVTCYCGKEEKEVPCGDRKDWVVACGTVEQDLGWEGHYECDGVCGRPFVCGVHTCEKGCHPPSFVPPMCPLDPYIMQTCACGRFALPTVEQHDRYILEPESITTPKHDVNGKDIAYFLGPRTSCTVSVPTCKKQCIKTLPACSHQCGVSCHIGPCPPCIELIERTCRCGATKKMVKCGEVIEASEGNEAGDILCDRACIALRICGRHQCNRICCPLASLSAAQKGKGKKRAGLLDELDIDEGGLHECDLPCGKMLNCGNHRCERKDHRGVCGVCLQSIYEDLICPCGRTALEPPIPCGTIMTCNYPCARPSPPCGHARVPHACHEGVIVAGADPSQLIETSPCPPCPFLTSKQCACGKKMVDNVRCAQERVSCGTVCGKSLACGFHHCERLCHTDDCGTCTAVCGKFRKSCLPAQHPCTQTCHAPAACPEIEACLALVTLTCPCGLLRSSIPCSQTNSATQLKCTGECAIKKRNARLADALGISPEKREGLQAKVTYNDDLMTFAKANSKFVGLVEKTFADFITSDKRTQVLPHMPPERRKFVHDLASIYRMDTQMVDQEPHRSVQLIRRVDTRIPTPLLSASVPSLSPSLAVLGKLGDLRAPKAISSMTGGSAVWAKSQSKVAEAGGRWTAVVSRPGSGSSAPGASSSSGGTQVSAATLKLKPSSEAWVSYSVQRAREAASLEMGGEEEAVPDDWEDDAQ